MSGFFCVRREVRAQGDERDIRARRFVLSRSQAYTRAVNAGLNPMGYKILLELLVRARCRAVTEVRLSLDAASRHGGVTVAVNGRRCRSLSASARRASRS